VAEPTELPAPPAEWVTASQQRVERRQLARRIFDRVIDGAQGATLVSGYSGAQPAIEKLTVFEAWDLALAFAQAFLDEQAASDG
jgi:hypothetical protein